MPRSRGNPAPDRPAQAHQVGVARLGQVTHQPIGVTVIRRGEQPPEPSDAPVTEIDGHSVPVIADRILPPERHRSIADRLNYVKDALAEETGAPVISYVDRVVETDEETGTDHVVEHTISLKITKNRSVLGGTGPTMADAFNALLDYVGRFFSANAAQAGAE
jgi:hypothetical protein